MTADFEMFDEIDGFEEFNNEFDEFCQKLLPSAKMLLYCFRDKMVEKFSFQTLFFQNVSRKPRQHFFGVVKMICDSYISNGV